MVQGIKKLHNLPSHEMIKRILKRNLTKSDAAFLLIQLVRWGDQLRVVHEEITTKNTISDGQTKGGLNKM